MKRVRGFTLVELLIVILLASMVGAAIYSMFASSLEMMRRLSRAVIAEDVAVFMEKLDREVSSQVRFQGIPFEGGDSSVSFPARLETGSEISMDRGIGRITYGFNPSKRTLDRVQENVSQFYKKTGGQRIPVLAEVSKVSFEYLVYQKMYEAYEWVKIWDASENEGAVPLAVKLKFHCLQGEEEYAFERTIAVPVGGPAR